jgi:hypothetical protein
MSASAISQRVDAFVAGVIGSGPLAPAFDDALRRRRLIADGQRGLAMGGIPGAGPGAAEFPGKRRGGGGAEGGPGALGALTGAGRSTASGRVARAFAGERGQAAVIKIKSYASGAERVKATARYVASAADGIAEKDTGEHLIGAEAINAVLDRWEREYFETGQRRETKDTVSFSLQLAGPTDAVDITAGLSTVLDGHHFAYAVAERDGQTRIDVVATMQSTRAVTCRSRPSLDAPQGAERTTQFRLQPKDKAIAELGRAFAATIRHEVSVTGIAFHHGEPGTLKALARTAQGGERALRTETGVMVRSQDERLALVQTWRRIMQSRQTRDTMHLITSSKPGTNRTAFETATRAWLAESFGRHEYIFTIHDNTAHTHVHVLVVMRTRDRFERLRTSPAVLLDWRERFAERARANGIAMFAERRIAKGLDRPTTWRQGKRSERTQAPHQPEQASEARLMSASRAEWIETLRTLEASYRTERGFEAARSYAQGVIARLDTGLAAWSSQLRYSDIEKVTASRNVNGGGEPHLLARTIGAVDALIRKVEENMVTEAQARTALRETHGRIMKLAVMSRSVETRARFAAIANDIYERGNNAVSHAVEKRLAEQERERGPVRAAERDNEQSRRSHAEARDAERRQQEQERGRTDLNRRKGRERERE